MLTNEQQEEIRNLYHRYISGEVDFSKSFCSNDCFIYFYVSKDNSERYNTYKENDLLSFKVLLKEAKSGAYYFEVLSNFYYIKPIVRTYLAYENRTIKGLRSGAKKDYKAVLDYFNKVFKGLHSQLKEDLENHIISHKDYLDYFSHNTSHDFILSKNLVAREENN